MGTGYYAYTIMGVKMNRQQLKVRETEIVKLKNCDCVENDIYMKFCCKCGRENNQVIKTVTEKYHPSVNIGHGSHKLEGFEIRAFDDDDVYLVICCNEVSKYIIQDLHASVKCEYTLDELSKEKERLKNVLLRNNICTADYFDDNFGIYTVLLSC